MTSLIQLLSGIKRESSVWDYLHYDDKANKSHYAVLNDKGQECGFNRAGKKD
jgi:hypothetical protein